MGKQKKRKTDHLSNAEIWDDSALIRSWDEAVAEYERYHSIHARGEDIEEVLKQAELEEKTNSTTSAKTNGKHVTKVAAVTTDDDYEDGEIENENFEDSNAAVEEDGATISESKHTAAPSVMHTNASIQEQPSVAAANGPNQVLENVKMAYWWAGYYSGLYEGQQSATTITAQQQKK